MIKLALALAIITAAATGAQAADKLPDAMLGSWCLDSVKGTKGTTPNYKRGECEDALVIGPNGLSVDQGALVCTALRTNHVTGGHGVWVYRVRYRCKASGTLHGLEPAKPFTETMTLSMGTPPGPALLTIEGGDALVGD